jgi:hypothetical protein
MILQVVEIVGFNLAKMGHSILGGWGDSIDWDWQGANLLSLQR